MTSDPDRDCLECRRRRAQAELKQRIHDGEDCFAEEYFAADPELAENVENALDLIYDAEFCAYTEAGRPRSPEEYYQRFPQWRSKLEALFFFDGEGVEPHPTRVIHIIDPDGPREQYHFLEDISRSPNGNIVKVRHARLNRVVAIKTFAGGDPTDEERFRTGAREQERLRHPNILPVYDVGVSEDGQPCFSMEFADGGSLEEQIAGKPQPPKEAARLVQTLAEAVSYIHREGTIHRDLKPANILLIKKPKARTAKSENGANGAVSDYGLRITDFEFKISDLGLARRVETPSRFSKSGEILGTVPYMAPEQAAGRIHEVCPISDVYALGAILYELLTGKPPFQAKALLESLQQIIKQPPVRPRRLLRSVPRGLESICLKCMEKQARRRYRSAQALADDLGRWIAGKRPEADASVARASRFLRKCAMLNKAAALISLAVVSTTGGLTLGFMMFVGPSATPPPDPQAEELRVMQQEFAEGKPVRLLNEEGRPRYQKWRYGNGRLESSLEGGGTLVVDAWSPTWLELWPGDPTGKGYWFRASVQHKGAAKGWAGTYTCYNEFDSDDGKAQYISTLWFTEQGQVRKRDDKNVSGAKLANMLFSDFVTSDVSIFAMSTPFEPQANAWRSLEWKVTPDQILISFEGQLVQKLKTHELTDLLKRLGCQPGDEVPFVARRVVAGPQQPLGIILKEGAVAFRDAVVIPLN